MTHYTVDVSITIGLNCEINTSCRGKYVHYDPQTNIHLGKEIV